MIEKDRHRKAFELYYSQGDARSLSKLAKKLGLALNTVKNWSAQFGWQERLEERSVERVTFAFDLAAAQALSEGLAGAVEVTR